MQAELDSCERAGDFAGDEGFATDGAFMVEQDAVAGVDAIGFAVVDGDPVGVELGYGIRAARIEGGGFVAASAIALRRSLWRDPNRAAS